MQRAFLLIYEILYFIAVLMLLPKEYLKRSINTRKRWIREKFGFFLESKKNKKPLIWIHAVSVGEVIAISTFVKKLSQEYEILLSTITDTGQKIANDRFKEFPVNVIYMPFDISFAIKKTLKFFNPLCLILTETEIWPNLISITSKKIPVILVNGRLSEKSFNGYSKIKFFIKPVLEKLELVCVQEDLYKEKYINLGVIPEKIYVTGNMKFDIELEEIKFTWESLIPRPVILAGSTHSPEEELIIDAFLKTVDYGTLVIAPRHPERFNEVENLIKNKIALLKEKVFFSKLSHFEELNKNVQILIILIDQMGILGSLYRICDIAIIGGSFIPHGGQNPLEPAYWKKPIICGPYMHNFPFIEDFLKNKACLMINIDFLSVKIKELISNPEIISLMGNNAYEIFVKKSGATEKNLKLLTQSIGKNLLNNPKPDN